MNASTVKHRPRSFLAGLAQLRGPSLIIVVSAIGLVLFVAWAAVAQVEEVTRGEGKVIPSSKVQEIQSTEPAAVREILVRAGEMVTKDQLLVRMDDTESSSQLGQIEAESDSLAARAERLRAEGLGGGGSGCTAQMRASNAQACADEAALARVRAAQLNSTVTSLNAVIGQKESELEQAEAQARSLEQQLRGAQEEADRNRPLVPQGIVAATDLIKLDNRVAELRGQLETTRAKIPGIRFAIQQARADVSKARYGFQTEALSQRQEITTKLAVNEESLRGAAGRLQRAEIRAPMDGVVSNVQISTRGQFVNPGQIIMEVVPLGDKLLVEARVKPSDIAFVKEGDNAVVKVTAYDFSQYGGLQGKVVEVSDNSIYDEQAREAYFTVIVETDRAFLENRGRQLPITPGMVCTVDIITGKKSILRYLFKPFLKAQSEALRER